MKRVLEKIFSKNIKLNNKLEVENMINAIDFKTLKREQLNENLKNNNIKDLHLYELNPNIFKFMRVINFEIFSLLGALISVYLYFLYIINKENGDENWNSFDLKLYQKKDKFLEYKPVYDISLIFVIFYGVKIQKKMNNIKCTLLKSIYYNTANNRLIFKNFKNNDIEIMKKNYKFDYELDSGKVIFMNNNINYLTHGSWLNKNLINLIN